MTDPARASRLWLAIALAKDVGWEARVANLQHNLVEQGIPMPEEQNLQDPAHVAQVSPKSALQEVIITPVTETSRP